MSPDKQIIFPPKISSALRADTTVIFPTETLYGIGCSIQSERAIMRVFEIKGRAPGQPPPVLIAEENQLENLVEALQPSATLLMKHFWPGSLTLILPARGKIPSALCSFDEKQNARTIAVRRTAHPIAAALCAVLDSPVVATSANFSGAVGRAAQPQALSDIPTEFQTLADVVLNGGQVGGAPSTIVDCVCNPPRVLRAGAISIEDLQKISPDIYVA